MRSVTFPLWAGPAGKTAVYAPDTFTMVAFPLGCGHKNDTGLATVDAPGTLAVSAYRWFIDLLPGFYNRTPTPVLAYPRISSENNVIHSPRQGIRRVHQGVLKLTGNASPDLFQGIFG
jgi:hypothetical protein